MLGSYSMLVKTAPDVVSCQYVELKPPAPRFVFLEPMSVLVYNFMAVQHFNHYSNISLKEICLKEHGNQGVNYVLYMYSIIDLLGAEFYERGIIIFAIDITSLNKSCISLGFIFVEENDIPQFNMRCVKTRWLYCYTSNVVRFDKLFATQCSLTACHETYCQIVSYMQISVSFHFDFICFQCTMHSLCEKHYRRGHDDNAIP